MSAAEVISTGFEVSPEPSRLEALAEVVPLHKALSPRAQRRRTMRRRNRGVRPVDETEAKTTKWFKCDKAGPKGPEPERTRLRERIFRADVLDALCSDEAPPDTAETATTQVDERIDDVDVVLDRTVYADEAVAVVLVPADDGAATLATLDDEDDPDPELMALICGADVLNQVLELPGGFHVVDGSGRFSKREHLDHLALAAQTEPDWGDPEMWDFGRHEPTYLCVRA
jgi:hypothetical protein